MADLAARGYSGVLHTFSENDFAYYRGTMREIVEASHDAGLTVQASPWGLGRTFGGEAESRFVTFHPGGVPGARRRPPRRRRVPEQRRLPRVLQGVGRLGARVRRRLGLLGRAGLDGAGARRHRRRRRGGRCRCERCAERFGGPIPAELHARGAGVPRVVGRRLPARGARARRRARREEHGLPAAVDRRDARHLRLEPRRVAAGPHDVRDRPVLEALERVGRPVRAPLREAAARDVRAARRRLAALAAELRADGGRDPRARGGGCGGARGGGRRPLDVGLRGVRAHDAPRDAGRSAGLGRGERRAHAAQAASPRSAHDARARDADERRTTRRWRTRSPRRATRSPPRSTRSSRGSRAGGRLVYVGRRHVGQARRARRGGAAGRRSARRPARSSRSSPATARTRKTTPSAARPRSARSPSAPRTRWSASARAGRRRTRSRRSRGARGRCALRCARVRARQLARGARRARSGARGRAGGRLGLDAAEGGHGAEARAERALDGRDDAARPHVRRA